MDNDPASQSATDPADWRTLFTTAVGPAAWGTTYLVATQFLPAGRPLLAATLRTLPVGLLLVARTRLLPRGAWWWRVLGLGLLNIGLFQALLFVAAFRLPGGVAATVGAVQPLVAAALAALLLGERFTSRTALAGVAGLAGVAMLVLGPAAALDPVGIAAALAGTLTMAFGVVLTKRWGYPVDLLTYTGWLLVVGGVALAPVTLAVEGLPGALTTTNVLGFAWLGLVGTGLAYVVWFRGVGRLSIATTSFLVLLSPLVATLLGWLVLGEDLTAVQLIGAVLVASAVAWPKERRPSTPGRPGVARPAVAGVSPR